MWSSNSRPSTSFPCMLAMYLNSGWSVTSPSEFRTLPRGAALSHVFETYCKHCQGAWNKDTRDERHAEENVNEYMDWKINLPVDIYYTYFKWIHVLNTLTYSVEQSPSWQANSFSASQEVPRILWNPKDYCRACKCAHIYKVKWYRYRPGVAQRVSRGIALLFHDHGTRRGWAVSSTHRPHFTPGKDSVPIVQEAGWAPGPVWMGGKSRTHRDSIPDRPDLSQSLYWLSYPAHYIYIYIYIYIWGRRWHSG